MNRIDGFGNTQWRSQPYGNGDAANGALDGHTVAIMEARAKVATAHQAVAAAIDGWFGQNGFGMSSTLAELQAAERAAEAELEGLLALDDLSENFDTALRSDDETYEASRPPRIDYFNPYMGGSPDI